MRCFIAIDIDEETRAGLHDVQQEIAAQANIRKSDVKWVHPESMHLTLKFLGEIKDREVVDVCNIVRAVTSRHKTFNFSIREVGHFGGRSARVLWVGAGLECPELAQLQQDLEKKLDTAGWPKENRKFSGHLTLGRVRNTKAGFELAQLTEQYKDFDLGTIRCHEVTVYQSQLKPEGPIYTALGQYELL